MLIEEDMVRQMSTRNHREGDLDPAIYGRNIAEKYDLDMQSVIIHYGDGKGCGYPGFDYRRL